MIDRRILKNIDWVLVGLLCFNALIGVVFIHSSSHLIPGNHALKQLVWLAVSLIFLFLLLTVDYQVLLTFSPYLYLGTLAVLMSLLIFAKLVANTKSWIRLAFFQIQPSEIAKVVMILILARLFSEFRKDFLISHTVMTASLLILGPVLLIALQPDLGTAMTFVPIIVGAFLLGGLKKKIIIILVIALTLAGVLGWNFGLKDYQKKRLTTLVDPRQDPRGSGYQIIQSKIAIGSGGLLGKGFMKGSQSQLRFLPARHTDFILSVIGEETGFLGVFVVMLSFFLLLARMFQTIGKVRDRAGVYIVFMASLLLSFEFLVNVLMVIGLFPVTGVPLPLVSYGGSSLLAHFLICGLVVNVRMRRFANL